MTILLRYRSSSFPFTQPTQQHKIHKIQKMFTLQEFLELFENNFDSFRLGSLVGQQNFMTSTSNNQFVREQALKYRASLQTARTGGYSSSPFSSWSLLLCVKKYLSQINESPSFFKAAMHGAAVTPLAPIQLTVLFLLPVPRPVNLQLRREIHLLLRAPQDLP